MNDMWPPDAPAPPPPGWRGSGLARFAVFLAVSVPLGLVALGISYAVDHDGPAEGPGAVILAVGLSAAAVLAYVIVGRRVEGRTTVSELAPRRAGGLLAGVGVGVALVALCAAGMWILGGLELAGLRAGGIPNWLYELTMTGVFAATVEEILCRGLLFRYLEQRWGTWIGLAVSALVFGVPHVLSSDDAPGVRVAAIATAAGLVFGGVYLLTRSLWWVMGVHGAWNVTATLGLGIPVSGNVNDGLVVTAPSGSELVSGGLYGIEASLVTLAVLGATAAALIVVARRRAVIVGPVDVRPAGR